MGRSLLLLMAYCASRVSAHIQLALYRVLLLDERCQCSMGMCRGFCLGRWDCTRGSKTRKLKMYSGMQRRYLLSVFLAILVMWRVVFLDAGIRVLWNLVRPSAHLNRNAANVQSKTPVAHTPRVWHSRRAIQRGSRA